MVLLVQISMCILPESLVRGTQGGWGTPMTTLDGQKRPVLLVEAVVVGKSWEGRRTLPFLRDALTKGRENEPPSLAGAAHRAGSCQSRNTASVAKKYNIFKSWGICLGMSKSGISTDMIFLKFSFSSLNSLIWIFIQISPPKFSPSVWIYLPSCSQGEGGVLY